MRYRRGLAAYLLCLALASVMLYTAWSDPTPCGRAARWYAAGWLLFVNPFLLTLLAAPYALRSLEKRRDEVQADEERA